MGIYHIFRDIYTCEFKHELYQAERQNNDEVPACAAEPAFEGSSAGTHIATMDHGPSETADRASTGDMNSNASMQVQSMA